MKYLILIALLFGVVYAQRFPVYERSCEERKAYFNELSKTDFSTAAVCDKF